MNSKLGVLLLLLAMGIVQAGRGQALPEMELDTTTVEYEYWKPRYYDSLAIADPWPSRAEHSFEDMVVRYQSKEFSYVESISDKLNFFDTLIERIKRFLNSLLPQRSFEFGQGLNTVLGLIGGIIVLLLIYKMFFSGKKIHLKLADEDDSAEDQISFVERNLMQVDLLPYIRDAENKGNYAVAIRFQQLYNIQLLQEKGHIEWRHNKTNVELMEEVTNSTLKKEFLDCAAIYDHIWFGDFSIEQADYERYEKVFKQFQQRWR